MATFNKFNDFTEQLTRGVHDFDAHTFKVMLSSSADAPVATDTVRADITTELTTGAGYTSGGAATTITVSETSGTTTVQGTEVVFTAAGGNIGPFRYVTLYNDSATSPADALVGWWDYGGNVTLADTETFTVKFNNATPGTIFTLV